MTLVHVVPLWVMLPNPLASTLTTLSYPGPAFLLPKGLLIACSSEQKLKYGLKGSSLSDPALILFRKPHLSFLCMGFTLIPRRVSYSVICYPLFIVSPLLKCPFLVELYPILSASLVISNSLRPQKSVAYQAPLSMEFSRQE